jgi:chromate transporter
VETVVIFAVALGLLFASKARLLIPAVIAAAALWGGLLRPLAGAAG